MTEIDKFIFEMAFRNAWGPAKSRTKNNSRYRDEFEHETCTKLVKEFCKKLVQQNKIITKCDHYKNIQTLYAYGLKIWAAQKVLSVIIKMYWCMGKLPRPEVCPIDRLVMRHGKFDVNWTQIEDIDEYKRIMDKLIADNENIADWELQLWNDEFIK